MDDLSGLSWTNNSSSAQKQPNYNSTFTALKPTPPGSGRVSPLPNSAALKPLAKPTVGHGDSFSNLVSFSSGASNKNVSLQEQQKRLADLKQQQASNARKTLQDQYGGGDDSFWNNLGSGRSTPQVQNSNESQNVEEEDFLAAFNQPQRVVQSKPPVQASRPTLATANDEDDDPFGLSEFQAKQSANISSKPKPQPSQPTLGSDGDDDDVLGLLGKPVSERPPPLREESPKPETTNAHPQDRAVAELVDMGFPPDKSRQALEATESGVDVQAAVGWLLNQAHVDARERSRARNGDSNGTERTSGSRTREVPIAPRREQRGATPSSDPGKMATELGTNFMKSAGSFWKQAQKKAQQAYQDFSSDSDSSQPKWMREAQSDSKPARRKDADGDGRRSRPGQGQAQDTGATDEAMMLESSRPEKPPRPTQRHRPDIVFDSSANNSRDHSPAVPSRLRDSHSPQPAAPKPRPQQAPSSRVALSRQAAEEQASQAYVSSARRRKPAASPAPTMSSRPGPSGDGELLEGSSRLAEASKPVNTVSASRPVKSVSTPVRPPVPVRELPQVTAIALKASHADREAGNTHFKRGDYASAHASYTRSLSHLPKKHPITFVLLTNRALTALKTGEPKVALTDSEAVITLIGVSKGESETVDLATGDAPKPMREYYGKALMRKAEALEQMERWAEAATAWREAVEGGHGGATAIQGRTRAERAANPAASKPRPAAPTTRKPATAARPRPVAVSKPGTEAAAVSRLRAQNAAADKLDDEKFALADSVDARITSWKGGKQDNLRALLGSLDTVLWPEAGWKKISMADLVLPNKVKIQYMKGIAKVHPDKIPTDATTEQRMIAGSVFSTLNEAWDKFKTENGL